MSRVGLYIWVPVHQIAYVTLKVADFYPETVFLKK